jgi:hypothetical protein
MRDLYGNELIPLSDEKREEIDLNPAAADWNDICKRYELDDEFIRMHGYEDEFNWDLMVQYQNLSEEILLDFEDYLDWIEVALNQRLSEDFIEDNLYRLGSQGFMSAISRIQHLSDEFVTKYLGELDAENLLLNPNISDNAKKIVKTWQDSYAVG